MAEPAIKYSIITAYSNKGVAAAEKGLAKLSKSFKKTSIARKLTFAAMGASFVALAKSSAQAAIADEKSIKVLAFTLDNLGRSFQQVPIENFIDKLSRATGIADQEIRPAFGQLITVTNNLAKSYEALALATDIAAVTGDDFTVITDALSKGFAGQTTALKKLIPGLDQAAIKAGDMTTLMKQLNDTFGGAAKNNITTYAGQLAILKISAGKALENIGKGLISFLKGFTKTNSITDLGLAIEDLGIKIGDIFRGLPVYIKTFFASTDKAFQESWFGRNVLLPLINALGKGLSDAATAASAAGKRIRELEAAGGWGRLFDTTVIKKFNKETKKTTDDMKKAAATTKLQGMFDIDAIQIAEALKGKVSDLDRARLEGMRALKTEATNDDIAAIKKIEYETLRANATLNSAQQLSAQNTFDFYKLIYGYAKDTSDEIAKLSFVPKLPGAPSTSTGTGGGGGAGTSNLPNPFVPGTIPDLSYLNFDLSGLGAANARMEAGIAGQQGSITVNVNPSGSGFIGNQDDFLRTVQMALQIGGRNGYSTSGLAGG
jgi:hypothetical protein